MNKLIGSLLIGMIGMCASVSYAMDNCTKETESVSSMNLAHIRPLDLTSSQLIVMLEEGEYQEGNYQWKIVGLGNGFYDKITPIYKDMFLNSLRCGYVFGISYMSPYSHEDQGVFAYHANGEAVNTTLNTVLCRGWSIFLNWKLNTYQVL